MIVNQIARIVADIIIFLNLTDEENLNLDEAVEMMELIGSRLDALDKDFLRELVDAFPMIAEEYSGEAQKLVRRIPRDFYLEETLAGDDPVRLAELDAQRAAED